MKSVIIIGASGHGKVIADIIQKSGDKVYGFLDDNTELSDTFLGFPVLGTIDKYKKYSNIAEFVIAIGDAETRNAISKKIQYHFLITQVFLLFFLSNTSFLKYQIYSNQLH